MYYYETLNSIDYRGSMTSLQSCQSGFSTISKVCTVNFQRSYLFQHVVKGLVNLPSTFPNNPCLTSCIWAISGWSKIGSYQGPGKSVQNKCCCCEQ